MSTDTESKTLPVQTLRLASLKATIWANAGSTERTYYTSRLVRSYRLPPEKREQGDEGWRETSSMSEEDLILVRELARRATEWIRLRMIADAESAGEGTTEF